MYSTHVYYATHCPGWGGGEGGRNLKRKGNKRKEQQRGHQVQRRGGGRKVGVQYTVPSLKPSELFSGHGIIDQCLNLQLLITLRDSDFNFFMLQIT
jgi:hypothetical protein